MIERRKLLTELVKQRARRRAIGFGSGLLVLAAAGSFAITPDSTSTPLAAEAAPSSYVAYSTLSLVADLSERQLYIYKDGETIGTYAVAVGKPKNPTPRGNFAIKKVVWNPSWVPPDAPWARGKKPKEPWHPANPMKTVKLFFSEPDYYIHGTGELESLGTAASHGCLRMSPTDVAEVARIVMENGGAPREPSWFEEVINGGATKTVKLPNPVRMSVVD